MVRVEEGREFRFCGDLYSQESTFPLVIKCYYIDLIIDGTYFLSFLSCFLKCSMFYVLS